MIGFDSETSSIHPFRDMHQIVTYMKHYLNAWSLMMSAKDGGSLLLSPRSPAKFLKPTDHQVFQNYSVRVCVRVCVRARACMIRSCSDWFCGCSNAMVIVSIWHYNAYWEVTAKNKCCIIQCINDWHQQWCFPTDRRMDSSVTLPCLVWLHETMQTLSGSCIMNMHTQHSPRHNIIPVDHSMIPCALPLDEERLHTYIIEAYSCAVWSD